MIVYLDWLMDLFIDMFSNLKEIWLLVIFFGFELVFIIGYDKVLLRKVVEIFNISFGD